MHTNRQIRQIFDIINVMVDNDLLNENSLNNLLPIGGENDSDKQKTFLARMLFDETNKCLDTEVKDNLMNKYLITIGAN